MPEVGKLDELVRGELVVREPAGFEHSALVRAIAMRVQAYATEHGLGVTTVADGGYLLEENPDTVRVPDVGFIRQERIAEQGIPSGFWHGSPDLAVEVLSPNDSKKATLRKGQSYLDAGTQIVWIADPLGRTVTVLRPDTAPAVLGPDDVADGGNALPGFRMRVAELLTLS
ncbi:MAG: Uma2 family endonuclease [Gemmatimonadaceae bacterium]|nr:Uma2 family endonuclease [Gemmatimonadaceae bacterium]